MKKTYGSSIRIFAAVLIAAIFLGGVLTGCVAEKEESDKQNLIQIDPITNETQQTTAPDAEESDPTATSPYDPTEQDNAQSTEPEETIPATDPSESVPDTEPDETTEPFSPTEPEATDSPDEPGNGVTYLEYYAMSAEQQQAFIDSFESLDAFFAWHTAAKEEYESGRTPIDGGTLTP